jgi:predicted TPR repeat methyltransferase
MQDKTDDRGFDDWVGQVYGAKTNEEVKEKYDAWAADYDRDVESVRYGVPAVAAGLFGRYVAPDAGEILDAGCGTGLLGDPLNLLGYRALTGVDLSPEMLARAEARGVYQELRAMDLGARLDFANDRFAAATALGVLTPGHAPPTALDEMLRTTRPGGHLIFTVSQPAYEDCGFKEHMATIDGGGLWESLETTPSFRAIPGSKTEGNIEVRFYVYRVR